MEIKIECCDLCHTPIKGRKNGIALECGYSEGGWGNRRNQIDWSGEVCPKCYEEYKTITRAIELWLRKRHGSKRPNIIIQEHDVSAVWTDEPPSRGREARLLR
jgi:hypothetical protein